MVDRQEVEALLVRANQPTTQYQTCTKVPLETLAALCRAWLALDGAEVVDIRNDGQNDGESALLGAASRAGYYRHGTRLRIVPVEGDQ